MNVYVLWESFEHQIKLDKNDNVGADSHGRLLNKQSKMKALIKE